MIRGLRERVDRRTDGDTVVVVSGTVAGGTVDPDGGTVTAGVAGAGEEVDVGEDNGGFDGLDIDGMSSSFTL